MTTVLVPLLILLQLFTVSAYKNLLGNGFETSFFDINIDRSHPEKLYKEFEDFIVKYKRSYKDEIEKNFRFNQFVKTHNLVDKLTKKAVASGSDAKFGINKFADMSQEEFRNTLSRVSPGNHSHLPIFDLHNLKKKRSKRQLDNFPVNYDLRNKKVGGRYVLGPIKNQGACGCCWAFAATAVAEVALSVHLKKLKSLSDQEVCDCGATKAPGCKGGDPVLGFRYISENGITLEREYPYVDGQSNSMHCNAENHKRELDKFELDFYRIDPFNAEYQTMQHLNYLNIPVAVIFRIGDDFRTYEQNVLHSTLCDEAKKAVWHSGAIVGYGSKVNSLGKLEDYWLVRNSWDSDWGEQGYFRVARGVNWCDIESQATGARIPEQ